MIGTEHVQLMAAYNRWQNKSIFDAADSLSDAERREDLGAFFGSIEATLNHILWADRLWMSRFAGWPAPNVPDIPSSTGEINGWADLKTQRAALDARIIEWTQGLSAQDLSGDLSWYSGAMSRDITKPFWILLTHFFNHQTHHRGQAHAMLTSKGATPDDTDIPFMPGSA